MKIAVNSFEPGKTLVLLDADGPGKITHFWFTVSAFPDHPFISARSGAADLLGKLPRCHPSKFRWAIFSASVTENLINLSFA